MTPRVSGTKSPGSGGPPPHRITCGYSRSFGVVSVDSPKVRGWLAANQTLRPIALLGLASLVSGVLVGGLGGRVVMSVSARAAGVEMAGRLTENGNTIGVFTVGGTIALVLFGGLLGGMIGSVGVVASDPWLRWMGGFRGVGYGAVVLALFGYDTFASVDFLILDPVGLNVAMFLGLIVGFGLMVVLVVRILDKRLPDAADKEQAGWLVVVGLGAFPLGLSLLFFTSPSFCGCDPAYELGASLLVMIAATATHYLANITNLIPGWVQRAAPLAGYASLTAALVLGMLRTVDNLQRLF